MFNYKKLFHLKFTLVFLFLSNVVYADSHNLNEILELIQKDLKTLEKAVYSDSLNLKNSNSQNSFDENSEDVLTRHLLKLSEVESQFQELTNKFEEINFKIDKLSNRLSKVQSDNQLRFQDIENSLSSGEVSSKLTSRVEKQQPGSSQPQDLGSISYKDTETNEATQKIESIETTSSIVTETFEAEQNLLPNDVPEKQYEFATSFLQVGDYGMAERAFREFVITNSEHELAGNAQYWYAETFRIRQLYTDAATAYLEGYQKYPKSEKAPINLLKLGVSMVQIGEKEQGCKMIEGVTKQYPKAINLCSKKQSMNQKNLSVQNKKHKKILSQLNQPKISKIYKEFSSSLKVKDNLAVAVSGGPDSLALAYLTKCYSLYNGIKVKYYIVNHKLRKESSTEAKTVKKILKKIDIQCTILNWNGKKPSKNIQAIARDKRYSLLADECKKNEIKYLLLGHHLNDLFENFLIRIVRGSGLNGLISFSKNTKYRDKDLNILRPLLNLEKKDLLYISNEIFSFFVKDPSNINEDYKRTRIRNLIHSLEKEGLDVKKLKLTINNLKDSDRSIKFYVDKNLKKNVVLLKKKNIFILNNNFFDQSHEIIFRSLTKLIQKLGKKYYPVRGKSINELIEKINKKSFTKVTLGGCFIERVNETILISQERSHKSRNL